jgi:hypothetical protein
MDLLCIASAELGLYTSRYFEEVKREITEPHFCYYRVAQGDCSFVIGGPGGLPPEGVHKAEELRIVNGL